MEEIRVRVEGNSSKVGLCEYRAEENRAKAEGNNLFKGWSNINTGLMKLELWRKETV